MKLERIGSYVVERELGVGGMGTVYLARHEQTGRSVAVKVLSPALSRERGFVERFRREIEALKRLKSEHIVELYESGQEGELHYYVMEYVEGETLSQRLRRERRLPWKQVVEIALQICSALKAAHNAGVVHRDLKPSNIILTPDGRVKLTDFGIAQIFAASKLTVTGSIVGTPEFMSPEQAEGRRATKRSDLYSLGVLMYTMLTGRPPFVGRTTLDVIRKHRFGRFDRISAVVPDVPRRLEQIVDQLLEKDPDKRFPDAYVVSLRLREVLRREDESGRSTVADVEALDGEEPTVYLPPDGASDRPGPATLMHGLMKAELQRQAQPTAVGRLLNSTWFLLACLVLLVLGGVWWLRHPPVPPPSAEDSTTPPDDEVDRLLDLARRKVRVGDERGAERMLRSLADLLEQLPGRENELQLVRRQLRQLERQQQERAGRLTLAEQSLQRAAELAKAGQHEQAEAICRDVLVLYGDDPAADPVVERARRLLEQVGEPLAGSTGAARRSEARETSRDSPGGQGGATAVGPGDAAGRSGQEEASRSD